jgi:hypothetical protein
MQFSLSAHSIMCHLNRGSWQRTTLRRDLEGRWPPQLCLCIVCLAGDAAILNITAEFNRPPFFQLHASAAKMAINSITKSHALEWVRQCSEVWLRRPVDMMAAPWCVTCISGFAASCPCCRGCMWCPG